MKFVSKNSNLRVVLKHGIPAEPITGRAAVPGLYIKFEQGIVNVEDKETVDLMMRHDGFLNGDFIIAEDDYSDPFVRKNTEPEHDLTNIEYGHVGKALNPKSPVPMKPEVQKVIKDMAITMAKEIAPEMAKEILKKMVEAKKTEKIEKEIDQQKEEDRKGEEKPKRGRPKTKIKEETKEENSDSSESLKDKIEDSESND